MKRILLFVATNVAVLVLLSIVLRLLGVDSMLDQQGVAIDYNALLILSAVIGFGGSLISLAMSKFMAKRSMGVQIIERPGNSTEQWLMETVRRQAQQAGIGMPEVGIFQSPDPNAFATGMRRNDALVAVSSGLLQSMNADEVEAVLGHEISHVSNGDMITMGLLQGVVNTFVIFLSRVIGHVVDRVVFKTERGYGPAYFITSIVAQIDAALAGQRPGDHLGRQAVAGVFQERGCARLGIKATRVEVVPGLDEDQQAWPGDGLPNRAGEQGVALLLEQVSF